MAVMIIAVSVVVAFQNEIRDKVVGFGSHIQLTANDESNPISLQSSFLEDISEVKGIKSAHPFALLPVILQSRANSDSADVHGVICKGVNENYDWTFIKGNLKEGKLLSFENDREILISKYIADKLHLKLNDEVDVYYLKEDKGSKRKSTVVGIYESGLEDYDKEFAFIPLVQVQNLRQWGIGGRLDIEDSLAHGRMSLRIYPKGGNRNYRHDWGQGWDIRDYMTVLPFKDTTYRVITTDFSILPPGTGKQSVPLSVPDTAWLEMQVTTDTLSLTDAYEVEYLTDSTRRVRWDGLLVNIKIKSSGGSSKYYASGYEINVRNWQDLDVITQKVKESTGSIGDSGYKVMSIRELRDDIFSWLEMLDMNVVIIIVLTVLVAIINMSAALLVMILERTNAIGIFKAMGYSNWAIQKIFLYQAFYLILRGLLWGNVIGISFCLLQDQFGLIPLNQSTYYLSQVPVELNLWYILLLNLGTGVICLLALLLPSILISRIQAVKAIKFD